MDKAVFCGKLNKNKNKLRLILENHYHHRRPPAVHQSRSCLPRILKTPFGCTEVNLKLTATDLGEVQKEVYFGWHRGEWKSHR